MGAYMNALREEGSRETLLQEIERLLTDNTVLCDRIADLARQLAEAETSATMWKARCEQAEAQLAEARRALGFFASVIMSGEPWTEVCEQRYRAALAPAEDGPDTDYDPSRDM